MGNDRTGTQCAPLHVVDRDTPVDGGQAGGDTGPYKISASVGADVLIGLSSPMRWASIERAATGRPYGWLIEGAVINEGQRAGLSRPTMV